MISWSGTCAFSCLFQRLQWPDPIVRLVTAKNIARRLSEDSERLLPFFLKWMKTRTLELDVVNALAVLKLSGVHESVSYSEMKQVINAGSVLSYLILCDLYDEAKNDFDWVNNHSGFFEVDMSDDQDFNIVWKRQPSWNIYLFKSEAKIAGIPLKEQWAHEWKYIVDKGFPRSFSDYYFRITGTDNQKSHLTPLSLDASMSAFLRTLSIFVQHQIIEIDTAVFLSKHLIPFYLDSPEVGLGAAPENWGDKNQDIVNYLEGLISDNKGIVRLSGPWSWSNEELPIFDISVMGVVVKAGSELDQIEMVWEAFDFKYRDEFEEKIPVLTEKKRLIGHKGFEEKIQAVDLACRPIVVNWSTDGEPLWTHHLDWREYFSPYLKNIDLELEKKPSESGIDYLVNDTVVGQQEFWLNNWSPTFILESSPRLGSTLRLQKDFIQNYLVSHEEEIKYIYKITKASREKSYGEYTVSTEFGVLEV